MSGKLGQIHRNKATFVKLNIIVCGNVCEIVCTKSGHLTPWVLLKG